jgi:hypothetical protein
MSDRNRSAETSGELLLMPADNPGLSYVGVAQRFLLMQWHCMSRIM